MRRWVVPAIVVLAAMAFASSVSADSGASKVTYEVTIENLTYGQPFSVPVAATHRKSIRMFTVGELASAELEAMAEVGDQVPMFELLDDSRMVTEAIDVGVPLIPKGAFVPALPFLSDVVSFEIEARPGDRFSLASMLVCTNDGVTGLDAVKLPKQGESVFLLDGYDAGTEENIEESEYISDPCGLPGLLPFPGGFDGNDEVDTGPREPVRLHPGIVGDGDLTPGHGWQDPVAKVTITVVDDD